MRRIRIPNPRLLPSERTFLDADYTSGTSLTVVSNLGFANDDWAVVGEPGEEKTEAKDVTGITTNVGVTISAALKFTHNKTSPIYRSEWDQALIERKLTSSSTWAQVSASDIQWDKFETLYIDTGGDDTYDYRFRFYNSQAVRYSEYSPTQSGAGFSRRQVGTMIKNVRRKIKDPNKQRFQDSDIIAELGDGQNTIQALLPKLWFLKVDTIAVGNGIAAVAGTQKYSLAAYTNLNFISLVKFLYSSGGTSQRWNLVSLTEDEFDGYTYNQNAAGNDRAAGYTRLPPDSNSDQGYLKVYPTPLTSGIGTIYPIYYRKMSALNTIDDTTDLLHPEILEDYAAWKLHDLMGNNKEADQYKNLFYGPSAQSSDRRITGIALLVQENNAAKQSIGQPRSLFRYPGRRGGSGRRLDIYDADYIRENFF